MRLGGLALAVFLFGCGGEKEREVGPICTQLGEGCHEAGESGDPDAEACHEVGHAGDEDACEAELDDCLALCESLEGAHDTGH